jgi:hypothetical protein
MEECTMRPRIVGSQPAAPYATRSAQPMSAEHFRDAWAVAKLSVGIFRRDLLTFFPQTIIEPLSAPASRHGLDEGPNFQLDEEGGASVVAEVFGYRFRLISRDAAPFTENDKRMICAIAAVLRMRYYYLFEVPNPERLELFRGGSEDHYIAAFIEPAVYVPPASQASRIASTIQTLRTAALSTYENHRVSTGALLLGMQDGTVHSLGPTPPDALPYSVELTGLKSVHRLCDGKRTLFLVDQVGTLAGIVDIARFAAGIPDTGSPHVPCPRKYEPHARATQVGGNVSLVLSPNQEIKLFAAGMQAFAFAHGRWRILDPAAKYACWLSAVGSDELARVLFQAALDLAEVRQGGLFVVVREPAEAVGRLIAPHDLLSAEIASGPPAELTPRDPVAKRALHYLARGRNAIELDPAVLEALASLDGALLTDRGGNLLAFGAILRLEDMPGLYAAEGARTTAALVASRYGPVLKISEDGVVSCFLNGGRIWDL